MQACVARPCQRATRVGGAAELISGERVVIVEINGFSREWHVAIREVGQSLG